MYYIQDVQENNKNKNVNFKAKCLMVSKGTEKQF